ncbi:MAG: M6 family metalloprotease domain-containing protein [Candidatus Krumholzibacteriia bacterium]
MFTPWTVQRSVRAGACAALLVLSAAAFGSPVSGLRADLEQPDGSAVAVRVWGDEYHQRIEDLQGFTLIRDPRDGRICYAELAADGMLVSTGVVAGDPVPARLVRGLDLAPDRLAAKVEAAREAAGQPRPHPDKVDYPIPAVTGEVRGIALLVDFSDEPGTIPVADLDPFLNGIGYTGNGNNGSIRDYYRDVSGGRLDLTHAAPTYYYRAAHPKYWYEDPNQSPGWRARLLVEEALQDLERRGFDFSEYDANGDGYVDLVSCFYAGYPSWGWGTGLWPQAGEGGYHADGVIARLWQITPLKNTLVISTAAHEIGHALCQWPDLYDTGGESFGVGLYCLMSAPADYTNPVQPCGPLKLFSGWTETVALDGVMAQLEAPATGNRVFTVAHPSVTNELYVIENRQRSGRDVDLPDAGLAVWHVDWRGSNNREAQLPDIHYMVTLVQADGRWDLERRHNQGDTTDLFKAPDFSTFGPDTDPPASWWRIPTADLNLTNVSASADVMTFDFHDGIGIHPVELVNEPTELSAPWRITGADGYVKRGQGSHTAYVPTTGSYLVTWGEVPGWLAPPAATVYVDGQEPRPVVEGLYTHPPFGVAEVPILMGAGRGSAAEAVDYDADGDLDVYICRREGGDLLLRNDGGWQFTDRTPSALQQTANSIGVQWADVDADGDRDVFVVREDGPSVMLRQTGGVFGEPEFLPDELSGVRGALWIDFDGDRRLDLHLIRDGEADLLLRAPDKTAPALPEFEALDILPGLSFARRQAAAWCDYDGDARPDLYSITLYGANVLASNRMPERFANATHGGLGLPWRAGAAAWGDYDNDGDFDLYNAQDGAADVLFTQYDGVFVMESGANLGTTGAGKDVVWADFDNDGDLDLYLSRFDQPDRLLLGDGEGSWDEAPLLIDGLAGPSVAAVAADLDGDGGLDLTIVRDGEPTLMLHNTMARGHWLQVDPVWAGSQREPAGSVLRVHVGQEVYLRQVESRSGPSQVARRVHFGLGGAARVDSLVVIWPDGSRQVERDLAADQTVVVAKANADGPGDETPGVTGLFPPYPNPFNPGTTVAFDLARPARAVLTVYDVRGRRVAELHRGDLPAGRHTFRWEGRDDQDRGVAAGVYLVRFIGDGVVQNQRMTLVR